MVAQCDVDDLAPEYVPPLLRRRWTRAPWTAPPRPLLMKKGRPGMRVEALAPRAAGGGAGGALPRRLHDRGAALAGGAAHAPAGDGDGGVARLRGAREALRLPGGGERAKPEYEDVARAAAHLGITPLAAYRAMLADGVAREP
jgi:hypothetical protein